LRLRFFLQRIKDISGNRKSPASSGLFFCAEES